MKENLSLSIWEVKWCQRQAEVWELQAHASHAAQPEPQAPRAEGWLPITTPLPGLRLTISCTHYCLMSYGDKLVSSRN